AALLAWQVPLAVGKDHAIARIDVGAALVDEGDGLARLGRELREADVVDGLGGQPALRGRGKRAAECDRQERERAGDHAAIPAAARRFSSTFATKRSARIA